MKHVRKLIQKFKSLFFKNIVFSFYFVIILLLGIIAVPRIFAELQPARSVEIFSEKLNYINKEPGAWRVTKSAKWIGEGTAEITFDVDSILKSDTKYSDVLFVLDVSSSMKGEKLDKVKSDTTELITSLLSNDKNKVGLITFETTSQIISPFTNNRDALIDKISSLTVNNNTNYYQALVNVDNVLKDYKKENDRECIVLFLTDGYPNEETPNQVAQYSYLKSQYPFATINGVQYEMGSSILEPVKKISDNQFIADMETLNNVLFEASVSLVEYENFELTDYIDTNYFYVQNERDIKVKSGNVKFDKNNQKITWSLGDYKPGLKDSMSIRVRLKDDSFGKVSFYSTNEKEEIKSKIDDVEEVVISSKTPVLTDNYMVKYDANEPFGCNTDVVPEDRRHFVFDTVEISDSIPKCTGYQFMGWEIVTDGVKKVNGDYFTMPEEDVEIKASWSKLSINKSMDGRIKERMTLYEQVEADYNNGGNVAKYTGSKSTFKGNADVYYYYGDTPNNNVVFGGFCWRMYRTTDTGGVKMVYNGIPDRDGKCGDDRTNNTIYSGAYSSHVDEEYYYGTDFYYDVASKTFNLSGNIEMAIWSDSTYSNLIGKYTCRNVTGNCKTLYQIESYYSDTEAFLYEMKNSSINSEIGKSGFNSSGSSASDVGYMYNKRYPLHDMIYSFKDIKLTGIKSIYLANKPIDFYFGDDVKWGEVVADNYNLVNPFKIESAEDYANLVGKYTFRNSEEGYTGSSVYYIVSASTNYIYYVTLSKGENLDDINTSFYFADSFVENESGKVSLDPKSLKEVKLIDLYDNRSKLSRKFYCETLECSTPYYLDDFFFEDLWLFPYYKYGSSYTYNEETGKYTLSGNTEYLYDLMKDFDKLSNLHYTCLNADGTCETLKYINSADKNTDASGNLDVLTVLSLNNGEDIDDALDTMLYADDVNANNSTIKNDIDLWYSQNMTLYTDFLEDTVWCNNRKIFRRNDVVFNPNGLFFADYTYFMGATTSKDLICPNLNDRFTVNAANGNGKLTYPVGLVTGVEQKLAYSSNSSPLASGSKYWSLSPSIFSNVAVGLSINADGESGYEFVYKTNSVRPAISLRSGISCSAGNGTVDNPYVVDLQAYEYQITVDGNALIRPSKDSALAGEKIRLVSDNYVIESFKVNGKLVVGNGFIMPKGRAKITDIVATRVSYKITVDGNDDIVPSVNNVKENENIVLQSKSDSYRVTSFKMNGILIEGNSFVMPADDVIITDIVTTKIRFKITVDGNDDIVPSVNSAKENETVKLNSRSNNNFVTSFKMNGNLIDGNSFVMPIGDVIITDIVTIKCTVIESEHSPYSDNLNDVNEKTFEGATSLTVELDYQTESTNYDWIYLYDSTGKVYGKYGGTTRKTETITIPGNYIKIIFRTDSSRGDYYGFKASIIPNYN